MNAVEKLRRAFIITWVLVVVVILGVIYFAVEERSSNGNYFDLVIVIAMVLAILYLVYRALTKSAKKSAQ